MATTARQSTIDKVNAALAAVVTAQANLAQAVAAVASAEAILELQQDKVGNGLRVFRSELELKVADVAPYAPAGASFRLQQANLIELEEGEAFELAAATRIRDYLVSVQASRL